MNKQELRIAIAKKCGIKVPCLACCEDNECATECLQNYNEEVNKLPNYTQDLNAIHEAIQYQRMIPLGEDFFAEYCEILMDICGGCNEATHATASQRAKAFCLLFWPKKSAAICEICG